MSLSSIQAFSRWHGHTDEPLIVIPNIARFARSSKNQLHDHPLPFGNGGGVLERERHAAALYGGRRAVKTARRSVIITD